MRSAIVQINTDLIIYQNINNFTQVTLYSFFISKKNWHSLLQTFFKTSFFSYLTVNEVCDNSKNTDFLINQLKNIFTQDTLHTSFILKTCTVHCRAFSKSTFYHIFTSFHVNISNRYLLPIILEKIQKSLFFIYPSSF